MFNLFDDVPSFTVSALGHQTARCPEMMVSLLRSVVVLSPQILHHYKSKFYINKDKKNTITMYCIPRTAQCFGIVGN